ncbi:MAG: hypothetical protein RLZZ238_2193 [Planctomycetota bacterium]
MILAQAPRWLALVAVFLVLLVVAYLCSLLAVVPLILVEGGFNEALHLLLRPVTAPFSFDVDRGVGLGFCIAAATIAATQTAFIAPLVGRPALVEEGHSLRATVVAAIVLAVLLSGGLLLVAMQAVILAFGAPDEASFEAIADHGIELPVTTGFLAAWGAIALGWTMLLWRAGASRNPAAIARFARWLLAGSAIELTLAVPLYLMARRREDCYCSLPTFWSILAGTTALFWLCGPFAALFLTREFRRGWARLACVRCGYPRGAGTPVCTECGHAH